MIYKLYTTKMDKETNSCENVRNTMTLDVPDVGSNRRKNCKPAKTIKADKQEQEYYLGGTWLDGAMLQSKNQTRQADRFSDETSSIETARKRLKMEPEEMSIHEEIDDGQFNVELDKQEKQKMDKCEERTVYVVSCCSNCLILKKEIKELKAELERIKKDAIPVPNQSVVDYFQAVINTCGKLPSSSTYKEHSTPLETLSPPPPQQQVQLVKDCALFMETNVLLECLTSAREDPLQLLRNIIRATFTPNQLIEAGGLGLRRGHSKKPPLDANICQTLKTYIFNWCYKYGKSVPKERDLNRCFADTITYARRQATREEERNRQGHFSASQRDILTEISSLKVD
ncbi:uncharacterized protein LOC117124326 [Anneissia japonica]|uniref:uncharacterized protein LOC117124326 n=1 Tax=Anneissia japonica TaxID=1529436 RepID=UPI00142560FC|nr:uncharacterized protein LOC117124326 [Anneissia japonica]